MIIVADIYNSKCLSCSGLESKMVKVGSIVFCSKCFKLEFVDKGVYNTETSEINIKSQEYKDWFEVYKKYINQEYEE